MNRLLFLRYLSLEVVFNALSVGVFVLVWLDVVMPFSWWVLLALSVWAVYTTDHLIDAFKGPDIPVIARHRFHREHYGIISSTLILICLVNIFLLWRFPDFRLIAGGTLLLFLTGLYFAALRFSPRLRNLLPKEMIIAGIFLAGISFAPLLESFDSLKYTDIVMLFIFFLLAFAETALVSWFEQDQDRADGHPSFALKLGKQKSRKTLLIVLFISVLISIILIFLSENHIQKYGAIILMIMGTLLIQILLFPEFFVRKNYYRLAGDSVFMLPAILALFR
jgi:4-hydroxybenzoate polyprenyltransferase